MILNWIQRGSTTYLNVARRDSGEDIYTIEDLAQAHGLSIVEAERFNQVIISNGVAVFHSGRPFDADALLAAVQAYDASLASVTMDQGDLGITTTTTTTTTTSTTTTTTTTTTS